MKGHCKSASGCQDGTRTELSAVHLAYLYSFQSILNATLSPMCILNTIVPSKKCQIFINENLSQTLGTAESTLENTFDFINVALLVRVTCHQTSTGCTGTGRLVVCLCKKAKGQRGGFITTRLNASSRMAAPCLISSG